MGGAGPGMFRRALTDYYFWRVPCAGPWQPVAALLQTTTFGARKRLETPGPGPTPKKSFWYEMDMNDTKCTSNDVRFLEPLFAQTPYKTCSGLHFGGPKWVSIYDTKFTF